VLLESAKLHDIKRFIHVSTDEVYGEGTVDQVSGSGSSSSSSSGSSLY